MDQVKLKRTEGPWEVSDNGYRIVGPVEPGNPAGRDVCTMGGRVVNDHEGQANARLIAAAPDLLEAAKRVAGWLDLIKQDYPEIYAGFGDEVRSAIAKAEGAAVEAGKNTL